MKRLPRYWVYLLLSDCGLVYVGQTVNLRRRLKQHNATENRGWTGGRRWRLLTVRCYLTRNCAKLAEKRLKRSRFDKTNWIKNIDRLSILCERHGIQHRLAKPLTNSRKSSHRE